MSLPSTIRTRQDYREFLRLDLEAHGMKRWRFHHRFLKPELHYQRVLRRAEYAKTLGKPFYAVSRLLLIRSSVKTGITIQPGSFGPGLAIAHYGSITVNGRVRAGAFCRIHSATNLGILEGGTPTLGDYVYIAPGAVLFGGITVGSGALIGANSVVSSDVPENATAVGAPARIIEGSSSKRVMPPPIAARMP